MNLEEKISKISLQLKNEIINISDYIFSNPELGDKEFLSSKYLVNLLEANGFRIQYPYLEIETAFRAEFGDNDGPKIAFLPEYDALPGYGTNKENAHACGHNWIAAITVGAALVLSRLKDNFKGKIVVIGTPAEETVGRKADMVNRGAFQDIDAVFQMHLSSASSLNSCSLAMDAFEFKFKGKASHAAAAPDEGINALDAVNLTFAGISALRQQLKSDVRIHGIITQGGYAPNIIPDECACRFEVRSEKRSYLNKVSERVKNCAKGAALMTGAKLEISNFENSFDDLRVNKALMEISKKNLEICGIKDFAEIKNSSGSTDLGNVSHVCPTMYGNIGVGDGKTSPHEENFLDYVNSAEAKEKAIMVVQALCCSAIELYENPKILEEAKKELAVSRI
ncbi:M20 family metallopeptidase [Clostridium neuense]|uniref:Peptidase M20 domain-containing protein 2 n=1 Tax=Clostridium neuense TaxID=1728934 RepID=A0ABW8TG53_9CLOT